MPETILTYALVDLERARDQLRIPVGVTTFDDRITQEINYVTGAAERYCNRPLLSRTYTDQGHDGDGSDELLLREYPATAVSGAKRFLGDGITTQAMDITGARILKERVLRLVQDTFDLGCDSTLVSYTAGYHATTHAAQVKALQGAALRWIQVRYQDWKDGVGRASGVTVGGESLQLIETDVPRDVKAMLEPFRRFP